MISILLIIQYDNNHNFIRSLASISDWNTLGVHWRLSNNLIKAMACFYESGYLVDAQGDVEGLYPINIILLYSYCYYISLCSY